MKKNSTVKQTNQILIAMITGVGLICLLILKIMMPDVPSPQQLLPAEEIVDEVEKETIATITLDPGHGGYDDGSPGLNGELEKEITLELAKKIQTILEKQQVLVIMTRDNDQVSWESDNVADLDARLQIAHESQSEFMVSIHCNFSDEEQEYISGSEVYSNANQSDSLELAESINQQLKTLSANIPNRGVKTDMDLHLLMFNQLPSVIVEVGFLSNADDLAYITSETGQQQIAQAIAQGIMNQIK